jgi:hypothetical protein
MLRYYIGIILAVLFFGGFFVRSYWEEHVFKRDTERLLEYYKHVLPGTINDGNLNGARYAVYRYRNKKEKLWKMLEKKYDEAVRHVGEWDDYDDGKGTTDEETVDLDLDDIQEDGDADVGNEKEEPDL